LTSTGVGPGNGAASGSDARRPEATVRSRPSLTPASLLIVLLIFYLIVQIKLIVLLMMFALLFATLIERPVIRLEARGLPRAAAILTVYAAILLGLVALGLVFVPLLTSEFRHFSNDAPQMIDDVAAKWRTSDSQLLSKTGYRLLKQIEFRLENPPPPTGGTVIGLLSTAGAVIFGFIATFVIGFYYLMEKHLFKRLLLEQLAPETRDRVDYLWSEVESKVGDWLRGQLVLCLIIGGGAGIGYAIIGVKFWILLAVFAGITEAVPIIGPWIGGVPAFVLALGHSWQQAIAVAVFLVLLQFLENSVLVPRVMKGAIGLSPLTVFLAVLAGGAFMGPLGALLAIPFAAALQVIVSDALRTRRSRLDFEDTGGAAAAAGATHGPAWRHVLTNFLSDADDNRAAPPVDPSEPDAGASDPTSSLHGKRTT
jgi:predicted PurR-regulated permease PerM